MVRTSEPPRTATILFNPTDLASGRGLADEVAERLGDAILQGRLSPGQHVPELQVAEELGISRAPVREAARILAERGLLVSEPRQGFFVPELGLADLDDIYRLRIALECAAIQMMCDRRQVTDLAAVKARRAALDRAAEQNSSAALLSADQAFHAKIVEASGSPRLVRAYATLTGELQLVLRLVKGLYPDLQAYAATHDQIMSMLERWDGDATQAALDRHIRIGWVEVRDAYTNVIGTGIQAPDRHAARRPAPPQACAYPGHNVSNAGSMWAPLPTFMGVPMRRDLAGAKAAIIGLPFDCGTHPVRIGSRLGPASIREQSALVRRYEPPHHDFDPIAALGLVDCGDALVVPGAMRESLDTMEQAIAVIVEVGAIPIALGGDGAVSLPQMRALRHRYPDLCVLHIDAHTDTYPSHGSSERDLYNVATTFTRAAEEGLVDLDRSYHVGARGPTYMDGVFEYTRQKGYRLIHGADLLARGPEDVVAELRAAIGNRPVFLCFDMDFFDPSCAPGVCTPTWGGALAREGLALIRSLAGLRFVGFDVNTVSPPHDIGGMTAFLAAACVHQFLFLACKSPGVGLLPPNP